jgi:hypothetical protein
MRTTYTLADEPRGEQYRALLSRALKECAVAELVVRDGLGQNRSMHETLERLDKVRLSTREVSEWPGTRLLDGTANVHAFRLCAESMDVFASAVDGLFEWTQPSNPEDLSLLRADGSIWLASTSHERDAFLELDEHEARALAQDVSGLWLCRDGGEG